MEPYTIEHKLPVSDTKKEIDMSTSGNYDEFEKKFAKLNKKSGNTRKAKEFRKATNTHRVGGAIESPKDRLERQ